MQTQRFWPTTETANNVTCQGTVYPWNCDHNGHMNVQFYVAKFDEATWVFLSRLGLSAACLSESQTAMVSLEQRLNYYKEVFAGDSLYIVTTATEVRAKTILFQHTMFIGSRNEAAAQTQITGLHIDAKLRKALPLPAFVKESAARFNEAVYFP